MVGLNTHNVKDTRSTDVIKMDEHVTSKIKNSDKLTGHIRTVVEQLSRCLTTLAH